MPVALSAVGCHVAAGLGHADTSTCPNWTTNNQDRHPEHSTKPEVRKTRTLPESFAASSKENRKYAEMRIAEYRLRITDHGLSIYRSRRRIHTPEREQLKWWRV